MSEVEEVDTGDQDSAQGQQAEKTFTQAQLDSIIEKRLPGYKDLQSKASQFDALTQSTEDALAAVKAEAEELRVEVAWRDLIQQRNDVAASSGLDPKLWSRIQGETKDEIEADVKELLSIAGGRPSGGASKPSAFASGASGKKGASDKELAAEALRSLRR